MSRDERQTSLDLLTPEGEKALRDRAGVADLLEEHRWLTTFIAGLIPGGFTAAGLALAGVSLAWSLIAGGAVTTVVVLFFVVASIVLGRPVIPELVRGENEPEDVELLEGVRWESEAEAAREARRRNLAGSGDGYWIEVEVEPGVWAIERRAHRFSRGGAGSDGGSWGDAAGGGGDGG